MANLFEPEFDSESDRPGFARRRAKLGEQAGAERLGASLFELAPGSAAFPMHYHLGNEELLMVVDGSPVLRTPEGERELGPARWSPSRSARPARTRWSTAAPSRCGS